MDNLKITEPEILDVLIGNADPGLEARVRQAIRQNPDAMRIYARWAEMIPTIQNELAPIKQMSEHSRQAVLEQLRNERAEHEAGWLPEADGHLVASINAAAQRRETARHRWRLCLPRMLCAVALISPEDTDLFDEIDDSVSRAILPLGRRNRRRKRRRLAVATSVCTAALIVISCIYSLFLKPTDFVTVEQASGRVAALSFELAAPVKTAAKTVQLQVNPNTADKNFFDQAGLGKHGSASGGELEPGMRLKLPLRVQAGAGAQTVLRLPGRTVLTIDNPAMLTIESPRRVRQTAGTAAYRVNHSMGERFTVAIPQGSIEDLGTEFKVAVDEAGTGKTIVGVQAGHVRILPTQGPAAEVAAGEQAIIMASGATVEAQPAWSDLALERSRLKTRLLVKGPAPQEYKHETPPAGVRAVRYNSEGLSLTAWVSQIPNDGRRHPAVVFVHGGYSFAHEDWEAAAAYVKAGYVLMTPMLRGENGNPGNYEAYYGEVSDVIAAGRYLARQPGVDSSRVYLSGHSIGGVLVILASMIPSPFAAAAAFGGSTDPGQLYHGNWRSDTPFDAANPRERLLRTPKAFAASLRIPLTLIVGDQDAKLQEQSLEFIRQAERQGKICRMQTIPGDHRTSMTQAIQESVKIFNDFSPMRQ